MLSQAFTTIVASLKNFLGNFSIKSGNNQITTLSSPTPTTPKEIRDTASWLQSEKFLNFSSMEIVIPIGLSVTGMVYVKTLEQIWSDFLVNIDKDVLSPIAKNLAMIANDEESAKTKLTIRTLNTTYRLYKKDAQPAKDLMAKCIEGGRVDRTKFGNVFMSAADYEATMLRVLALRDQVVQQRLDIVNRSLETITTSVDTIVDFATVDPKLSEHLSDELMSASKWVEFYGVYLLALDEFSNALKATNDKIKSLSVKK